MERAERELQFWRRLACAARMRCTFHKASDERARLRRKRAEARRASARDAEGKGKERGKRKGWDGRRRG
eukprot:1338976-Pleurochrysis_carterae.AAC.2